jgi:hypothetical protein
MWSSGVVYCGVVSCGMVWCRVVWCGKVWTACCRSLCFAMLEGFINLSYIYFLSLLLFPFPFSSLSRLSAQNQLRDNKRLLIYPCGLFKAPLSPYKHGDGTCFCVLSAMVCELQGHLEAVCWTVSCY